MTDNTIKNAGVFKEIAVLLMTGFFIADFVPGASEKTVIAPQNRTVSHILRLAAATLCAGLPETGERKHLRHLR